MYSLQQDSPYKDLRCTKRAHSCGRTPGAVASPGRSSGRWSTGPGCRARTAPCAQGSPADTPALRAATFFSHHHQETDHISSRAQIKELWRFNSLVCLKAIGKSTTGVGVISRVGSVPCQALHFDCSLMSLYWLLLCYQPCAQASVCSTCGSSLKSDTRGSTPSEGRVGSVRSARGTNDRHGGSGACVQSHTCCARLLPHSLCR